MTRHVRLCELLVGVEALALLRRLLDGDDAAAEACIDEVRRLVGTAEEATFGARDRRGRVGPARRLCRWADRTTGLVTR